MAASIKLILMGIGRVINGTPTYHSAAPHQSRCKHSISLLANNLTGPHLVFQPHFDAFCANPQLDYVAYALYDLSDANAQRHGEIEICA